MRVKQYLAAFTLSSVLVAGAPFAALAQNEGINTAEISKYSVEQLEQLIAKLTRQLEELKKGSPCFVSEKDLSIGDGEDDGLTDDVRRLQNFLIEKGHLGYKATGYFGKATKAALSNFQKREGIAVSSQFDGATREKAHSMSCKKVTKAAMNEMQKMQDKEKMKMEDKQKQEMMNKEMMEKQRMEKEKMMMQAGQVKTITVKADGKKVNWSTDGYSKMGFKVVWSKTPGPMYPNRYPQDHYLYFDKPTQAEAFLEAFDGAGTYYVRVCEYLGGACGVYSNEVSTNLQ